MKRKVLLGLFVFAAAILLLFLFLNLNKPADNAILSYEFDPENFAVCFMANGGYTFVDIDSEYGKLELPNIAESDGAQTISISLDLLPLRDGEFIYLHLRYDDGTKHDYQIYAYELYQNERELYIWRCKDNRGSGIHLHSDIYDLETGELISSR